MQEVIASGFENAMVVVIRGNDAVRGCFGTDGLGEGAAGTERAAAWGVGSRRDFAGK